MKSPSDTFIRYTDAQWAAIQQTLPQKGSPSGRDIRFELEQMGREFWGMRAKRVRKPTARERAGLLRCIKWIEEELEHLQLRRALKPAYEIMTAWASLLDAWNSRAFQGQADAHRWLLYHRMFRLWMGVLGGELGASRDKYDQPSGPLVCFFEAAVNPILDPKERLGREGIRKIIREEIKRIRDYPKVWKGFPDRRWEAPVDDDDS